MKTLEEYFIDWWNHYFGHGYGTGEVYVLPALRSFLNLCRENPPNPRMYNHERITAAIGGAATWLLIEILERADIIEYGTSPRHGWLTGKGERLRDFVTTKTDQELVDIVGGGIVESFCNPEDWCACEGRIIKGHDGEYGFRIPCINNPFWNDK